MSPPEAVVPSKRAYRGRPLAIETVVATRLRIVLLLALFAIATRMQIYGNPIADTDEGFYLLVGERMLHGVLPYVGIWDRKPFGLFLLYAGMRSLGGDGVIAYQLTGTLFAFLTALSVSRIAAACRVSSGSRWPAGWFSTTWPRTSSSTSRKRPLRGTTVATVTCGRQMSASSSSAAGSGIWLIGAS